MSVSQSIINLYSFTNSCKMTISNYVLKNTVNFIHINKPQGWWEFIKISKLTQHNRLKKILRQTYHRQILQIIQLHRKYNACNACFWWNSQMFRLAVKKTPINPEVVEFTFTFLWSDIHAIKLLLNFNENTQCCL